MIETGALTADKMWIKSVDLREAYWKEKLGHVKSQISTLKTEKETHPDHRQINHIDNLLDKLDKTKIKIEGMLEGGNPPTDSPKTIKLGALGRQKETLEQYAMRVNAQNLPEGHKRRLILARAADEKRLGVDQQSRIPLRDRVAIG